MVLSDVSIKRPVFATVISLLVTVLGVAAFVRCRFASIPRSTRRSSRSPPSTRAPPTTSSRAASPSRIEGVVAGIEGVKSITSQSREERSQVTVEFRLNRNVDAAAADVRDRVARVRARLPEATEDPVVAKVDSDARSIIFFSLSSDRMNQMEMTDFARRNLVDKLSIVPGVAQVFIAGERRFSMRIWLDRQALAARQITVEDVEQAIKRQNIELPSGRLESTQRELTVKTDTRLATPEQFRAIVVSTRGGYSGPARRGRQGRDRPRGLAHRDAHQRAHRDRLGILRQSTANTLEVAEGTKAEMDRLRGSFPEGMDYIVGYDESVFIKQSIYEVFTR
jgi:multidrug efflux pump